MYKFVFMIEIPNNSIYGDKELCVVGKSIQWPDNGMSLEDMDAMKEMVPSSVDDINELLAMIKFCTMRMRFASNADGMFCINTQTELDIDELEFMLNDKPKDELKEFLKNARI